jgi:hypothetical protein
MPRRISCRGCPCVRRSTEVNRAVEQYLTRYAEKEARGRLSLPTSYAHVLVVPVCREGAGLLDGYEGAASAARGRVLCILVVNGREDASPDTHVVNARLWGALLQRLRGVRPVEGSSRVFFGEGTSFDLLLVDRQSPSARLPSGEGVGLARKIGLDLALALWTGGWLPGWAHMTDADATLPDDYFDREGRHGQCAAMVHPFVHVGGGDEDVHRRTEAYELYLRHWVYGLHQAGSPFAFHALGSALSVDLSAYAVVRGVPRREAGEDFYLLNKLAKVRPIHRGRGAPIEIRARISDRTPFGTGAAVDDLGRSDLELPPYQRFALLGALLDALDDLALHRDMAVFVDTIDALGLPPSAIAPVRTPSALDALSRVCSGATTPQDRRIRLHSYFDAFRTMKVLRALEPTWPKRPWAEILAEGPGAVARCTSVPSALMAYRRIEAEMPSFIGPLLERIVTVEAKAGDGRAEAR